ncbi:MULTISPECIES: hypothetical protein [unclassified Microbacterium]|uniref:hypothetical protein n=1 Tax=unclassified Microbacterium TaxID=2609290 RepID=UPI0011C3E9F0|nr:MULTISPECIES: hypothetical protein [unclassified Microbacterium]MBT2483556.1 hypothetical protein [Microbacterium sp. ISL-108]
MKLKTAVVGVVTALALGMLGSPAHASEPLPDDSMFFSSEDLNEMAPNGGAALDPDVFLQGLEELEASPAHRNEITEDGYTFYQYVVPEGSLTLPSAADVRAAIEADSAAEVPSDVITPFLEVRFSGIKMAVGFNTVDQQALAAGGGAAVAAALCLIPAVGWAACTVIGIVVGVATTYLVANGICSGGRTLWWYDVDGGSVINCRSSAPF